MTDGLPKTEHERAVFLAAFGATMATFIGPFAHSSDTYAPRALAAACMALEAFRSARPNGLPPLPAPINNAPAASVWEDDIRRSEREALTRQWHAATQLNDEDEANIRADERRKTLAECVRLGDEADRQDKSVASFTRLLRSLAK